ncbi:MAG: adenylate cyclase [Rubrivivax sp.]|nr:MAG: adenylate cyclase [Rubrivivax sp.]
MPACSRCWPPSKGGWKRRPACWATQIALTSSWVRETGRWARPGTRPTTWSAPPCPLPPAAVWRKRARKWRPRLCAMVPWPARGPEVESLSEWLKSIGLGRVERVLLDNDIDQEIIGSISEQDLEKLGVSMGDRKRLLRAIGALRQPAAPTTVPASATQGELRQLTIMFCDLVGSTQLAERLSPEQWRQVVLQYQQAAAGVIERFGGTIAQYLGDGLLVYFGHPQAQEDAPERAVRTGLALVDVIGELPVRPLGLDEALHLSVRIGIHTGLVVIGEIGGGARREHLALGDAPNLAARLQALAEPGTVLISDSTRKLAGAHFSIEDRGQPELKGVREPPRVWRVTAVNAATSRFDAATSAGLTPLVGRAHELALLSERWQAALSGRGQVVFLSGEPGIGKSRMLKELRDRLGNAGLGAVTLQCSPQHVHSAFHPSICYLERRLGLRRDQPAHLKLGLLERLVVGQWQRPESQVALLASMLSIPCEDRYGPIVDSPSQHERDTIAALADAVEAATRQSPTLLLLEDAHWADPATLDWLNLLIERGADWPLLLVVTHRPEFQPSFHAAPHITTWRMPGLQRAEVAELVSRLSREVALPQALTQHILSRTDGVPLFIEELTKSILEAPSEPGQAGQRVAVPTTLRDSLMARLDRVPAAKEIAQIGSVLGREFSHELVEALSSMTRGELEAALAALTQSGLATRQAGHQGLVYTFKHALVQDAAYDSLLKPRREALHAAIVQVVEARFPALQSSEPEMLARHASAAGQPARAIPYWRRASEQALQRLSLQEATAYLDAGLVATSALPASSERDQTEMQLRASLGTVHMLGKGWAAPEVEAAYARATQLADATDKVEESIWPLWGLCVFHLVRGEITKGEAISRRMMSVARQSNSRSAWLVANMLETQVCLYTGRFAEVAPHWQQVELRYSDPKDRALIALYSTDIKLATMVHAAHAHWIGGDTAQAMALSAEQERIAASLNHPYSVAWSFTWGSTCHLYADDVEGMLSRATQGLAIADQHGFAYISGIATMIQGWCWTRQGALADGIARMQRGLSAFKATGAGIVVPFFQTLLAQALGEAGRHEEGLALLDDTQALTERGGERWHEAEMHRVRGQLLASRPVPDLVQAEACVRQALATAQAQQAGSWARRAQADLDALGLLRR